MIGTARSGSLDGPLGPAFRLLTIGVLLNTVSVAFEALAVSTVMPLVAADLGRYDLYGWVFSAFLLTNLVGIVVAGLHADAKGPAAPFIWGVILFALGLLLGGLAPSMEALIAARALQGFGGGALGSIAYVAVGRAYPETLRPRMLALLSTGWVVPGLIGPALSGWMGETIGWRWVFLGLAPMPVIAAFLALPRLRLIPGGAVTTDAAKRVALALGLAAGATALLTGLQLVGHDLPLGAALCGAGLLAVGPTLARLLPPGTLRAAPGMPAAIATIGLVNLAFFGVESFLPLAIVDLRHQSVIFVSMIFTAVTITWTAGSWIQERVAPGGTRRLMVVSGLVLLGIGVAGGLALLFPMTPMVLAPVIWGVAGLGMGLTFSTISLIVLETAPKGLEGQASSSIQLANMLGSGLGAGIGGALVASLGPTGPGLARALTVHFTAMIVVCALAFLLSFRLPARHVNSPVPSQATPEPAIAA